MTLIVIAILLWVVALVRLARWAASPALSPSLGAAIVLSSLAARVTLFNVPALSEWLDNVTSWPNLATLAQLLFLVSATAGAQIVVIGLTPEIRSPGRLVRHMLALGLAVAVLVTVLFVATGRQGRISVYEYAAEYSSDGWIAGAFLLTIGYGATGCVAITAISIRTLRRSGNQWRPQLLLLALGGGLFTCYALTRAALIWAGHVNKQWLVQPVFDAGSLIAAVACILVVIGLTWESAGGVVRAWRYLKRSRALFGQIDLVAPEMAKHADRIAGWSVTRRAEARSVAILDFLTLITDTGKENFSVKSLEVNDVLPTARAKMIADWLDLRLPRNQVRMRPHDLAPPPGWPAAAWVNLVLLQRPSNEESRLLHSLHP